MVRRKEFPYLIRLTSLLGLILYIVLSWYFANSVNSVGDEGSYVYKGYLFARGDVRPFEEYTFWTNKSPLAFLIPGYIQLWFGPGLREARYFAIFVGALMLVGIWVTARRMGGEAGGAIAVWVFALSTAQISIYSEALSQGLVACMMAWMFALTLGESQRRWQLILGAVLSILIVMTRQNMLLVPFFLVLYIFWQYGKQAGLWVFSTCAVLFIAFHLLYWPNILQIWAPWLPKSLTPFLDSFRASDASSLLRPGNVDWQTRWQSFATGMRDNVFIFFGSLSAIAVFPRFSRWKHPARFKMAIFSGVTFFVLFIMHTMASIFTYYCVYCFSGYQMFYTTAGLFFILLVAWNGLDGLRPWHAIALMVILLFFAAMLGLYHYQDWSGWLLDHIRLPRLNATVKNRELLTSSLRDVFTYSLNLALPAQKRLASILGGLFLGIGTCFVLWLMNRLLPRIKRAYPRAFANTIMVGGLMISAFYPFVQSAGALGSRPCSLNFLTYYERAGESLSKLIPPGSALYWRSGGRQLALLLYVEDVKLFLPQIHAGGGYRPDAPTDDDLLRLGLYNEEMDTQWRDSADVLTIWEEYMTRDLSASLQQSRFEQVPYDMGELAQCEDDLLVFRRIQ